MEVSNLTIGKKNRRIFQKKRAYFTLGYKCALKEKKRKRKGRKSTNQRLEKSKRKNRKERKKKYEKVPWTRQCLNKCAKLSKAKRKEKLYLLMLKIIVWHCVKNNCEKSKSVDASQENKRRGSCC